MVAEFTIKRIELLARGGAHDAGHAEIFPLAAGTHPDRGGLEVGRVLEDDVDHGLRGGRLRATHHLDGKVAGKSERGPCLGHRQVDTASPRFSLTPARITLCLNSW